MKTPYAPPTIVRIMLPCSKVLLLINYFDRRLSNTFKNILCSDVYIKGDKYLFFVKVGAANMFS